MNAMSFCTAQPQSHPSRRLKISIVRSPSKERPPEEKSLDEKIKKQRLKLQHYRDLLLSASRSKKKRMITLNERRHTEACVPRTGLEPALLNDVDMRAEFKTEKKERIKKERMISFSRNSDIFPVEGTPESSEELEAARCSPYAQLPDDIKPIFFFNVRPKFDDEYEEVEPDYSTPAFMESIRNTPTLLYDKKVSIDNTSRNQIYINKTTIINNIIGDSAKKQFDRVSQIYTRNMQNRLSRKLNATLLHSKYKLI